MKELTPDEEIEQYCKQQAELQRERVAETAFAFAITNKDFDYYLELLTIFNCNDTPINSIEYFERLERVEFNGEQLQFITKSEADGN